MGKVLMTPTSELFRPSPIAWQPHLGQRRGMRFLLEHAAGILASDPGVGKTTMVYGAFKVLRRQRLATKLLVVCPLKPAYLVWPAEREKWQDFHDLKVVVLHGKTRDEALIADADVCVINPDGLDWLTGARRVTSARGRVSVTVDRKRVNSFGFDVLVIDELTRFKHSSSGRFKIMKSIIDLFGRRWGLTGSLVANGLMDLFGQCYVIDQGRTFGPYVTHYRNAYFAPGPDGFTWQLQPGAAERIYERLRPLVLRQAAEDYVDMPSLVEVVHGLELPPAARRLYDALDDEMIARLDDHVITAANAAAMTTKLRQVANGGVYLQPDVVELLGKAVPKGGREWVNLHDEKIDAVESLLEELQGAPLLVAYEYEHDLDRLRRRFGADVPYVGGGVSPKRFKELEAAWNRGELPLLLGHPQSVAHGLNLQAAGNHICWHSLTWDLEFYDQFIGRLRRQGAKAKRVFNHLLIAKDTIDETILWALRSKDRGQRALYEALKTRRRR